MLPETSFAGRIVLCTAGTGGHVFPALAVFSALKEHGPLLVVDSRGAAYCKDLAAQDKWIFKKSANAPTFLGRFRSFLGLFCEGTGSLYRIWRKERPAVVVGFGGRTTLGPLLLARLLRIPTLIHEQNAIMGRANVLLSYLVKRVALSFPETRRCPRIGKRRHTGVPIRAAFFGQTPVPLKKRGDLRLCVFGGSQGARVFSSVVPRALALLPESLRKRLVVIQQVQEDTLPFVEAFYKVQGIRHELFCFSDELVSFAREAHLVICRAGASSLAEFAALGCPLLMIPYPYAMDDHQHANADFYTEHGAGWSLLEKDFTPASCAAFLEEHLPRLEELEEARKKIQAIAKPRAAEDLAQEIISLKYGRNAT